MTRRPMNLQAIVKQYGITCSESDITPLGTGLINSTWRISAKSENRQYVLQRVNSKVFSSPQDIAINLESLRKYLSANHPRYLFVAPMNTQENKVILQA